MLSGDNSILQKATDAKTNSDSAQTKEKIRLAYNSALTKDIADQKGEVYKSTFEDELKVEFPGKSIDIEESTNKKEWVVTIDGVTENVPIGKKEKSVAEADLDKLKEFFIGKTPDDWMKPNYIEFNDSDIIRITPRKPSNSRICDV